MSLGWSWERIKVPALWEVPPPVGEISWGGGGALESQRRARQSVSSNSNGNSPAQTVSATALHFPARDDCRQGLGTKAWALGIRFRERSGACYVGKNGLAMWKQAGATRV